MKEESPDLNFFLQAVSLADFRIFEKFKDIYNPATVFELRKLWMDLCHNEINSKSRYLLGGDLPTDESIGINSKGDAQTRSETLKDIKSSKSVSVGENCDVQSDSSEDEVITEKLDEMVTIDGDRRFVVTGVIHGLIGGGTKKYRDLIRSTLKESKEPLLFEAGFNHLYGEKNLPYTNIPDFAVLGFFDSMKKGVDAGRLLPFLFFDIFRELFSAMPEDSGFHTLDQEVRRGIEGILPTRLEVEWDRKKPTPFFSLEHYPNIVRRSAYMAAFARSFCEKTGRNSCRLVVGDFHLTECAWFLDNPQHIDEDLILLADRTTDQCQKRMSRIYLWRNIVHNTFAGFAGVAGLLPWLIIWILIQVYLF